MRDLKADLEICRAATPGPAKWQKFGGEYYLTGQYGIRPIILGTIEIENQRGFGSIAHISNRNQETGLLYPLNPNHPDSRFIEEAWEGWPEAIRRALEAEAQLAEVLEESTKLQNEAMRETERHQAAFEKLLLRFMAARQALQWIAQQGCSLRGTTAIYYQSCKESDRCITEYCLPYYAKAALYGDVGEDATAETQVKALDTVAEAARAVVADHEGNLAKYPQVLELAKALAALDGGPDAENCPRHPGKKCLGLTDKGCPAECKRLVAILAGGDPDGP